MDSVTGFILKTTPYGESDLIVHLLSPERGKLSVLSRGARKSKKHSCLIEPFDKGTFSLKTSKASYLRIEHFNPQKSFRQIRESLDRVALASLVCEICDRLTLEESEDEASIVYDSLLECLNKIEKEHELKELLRASFDFISFLLALSGYLDTTEPVKASMHSFRRLIRRVESVTEYKLRTAPALEVVLSKLQKEHTTNSRS